MNSTASGTAGSVRRDSIPHREVPVSDPAWRPVEAAFADSTISRRFEEQAARRPDAVAIVGEGGTLTFSEADQRANQIASAVRVHGSALGRPIAILLPHDVDLVLSILAVLKAGGIVLVLDPMAPAALSAAVLADAKPDSLITDGSLPELVAEISPDGLPTVLLDEGIDAQPAERLPLGAGPASPAMLAYSSGTTGSAKAAILPHRALLHLTRGAANALKLTDADRLPMLFPVSMAVAAYPMLLPLLVGGSLRIRDVRSVGLAGFREWLADEGVTVLYLSPTVARFLGDGEVDADLSGLRLVVLGGERVDGDAVAVVRGAFGPQATIANGYGTTETGVLTFFVIEDGAEFGAEGVPVGYPIEDTALSIVSDGGASLPAGEVGELVVRSRYLCSGYWGRPDLTGRVLTAIAESADFEYRTGDLAVIDETGALLLVGRSDTEVKVAGHRVIPGEVEQAMLALPEVADAVVEARPDAMGTNELVAWVVAAPGQDLGSIREATVAAVRGPMVPARIVLIPALPQLPNGKLDRRALPDPPASDPALAGDGAGGGADGGEPRTETEAAIAYIWSRILDVSPIGVHTDLAELGAQSLDVAWALVRVEEDLGVRVPMGEMIGVRTVAGLAAVVESARRPSHQASGLVEVQAGDPDRSRLYMVHDLHGSAFGLRHLSDRLGTDQPLWGFESPYLEGPEVPFRTLDTLALRYVTELKAVQPEGPYHLAGYSFGGVLAFEIARQLVEAGDDVPFLAVIDVGPGYRGRHYDPRKVLDKPWLRVSMPGDDLGAAQQVGWYARLARRNPVDAAMSLSIRTGADRWLDPLLFRYDLRRKGQISAGNRLWYAWRKHWELARSYVWEGRTYPGPLTLLWADESAATDGTMGWGDVVQGTVDIHHVRVAHERFLQPDGAAIIGPILRAALDAADGAEAGGTVAT